MRKAANLKPDWADTHYQLGLLYEDHTLWDEAIREYQITLRLQPNLATAHYRLAQLYRKKASSN